MLERLISFSPQLSISRHSLLAERLEFSAPENNVKGTLCDFQ